MIMTFFALLWTAQLGDSSVRTDLSSLDEARLRKNLESIYGEFGTKKNSEWQVAIQGRTEIWTWDGEKFSCPKVAAENSIDCNQWIPESFRWFLTSNRWLEPWVSMRRRNFFLGTPELKSRSTAVQLGNAIAPGSEEGMFDPEAPEAESTEDVQWDGKRLASRVWSWVGRDGQSIDVYISLRNSWIERIDPNSYSAEYLEWKKENRNSRPSLSKLTLDRDGVRVTFQHIRDIKKK